MPTVVAAALLTFSVPAHATYPITEDFDGMLTGWTVTRSSQMSSQTLVAVTGAGVQSPPNSGRLRAVQGNGCCCYGTQWVLATKNITIAQDTDYQLTGLITSVSGVVSSLVIDSVVRDSQSGAGSTAVDMTVALTAGAHTVALRIDMMQACAGTYNGFFDDVLLTALTVTPGTINDGVSNDIDFQTSLTTIDANWTGFTTSISTITGYRWAIGTTPGATDALAWTDVGLATAGNDPGLPLVDGQLYFAQALSLDANGYSSIPTVSDGVRTDATGPIAGVVNDGAGLDIDFQSSTTTVTANWNAFDDTLVGSGIAAYEWALGTTSGGTELQTWTNIGAVTSANNSFLMLSQAATVYVSVRAIDVMGNVGGSAVSDGVFIDASPPTGVVLDGLSGADWDVQSADDSLGGRWTIDDPDSGITALAWSIGTTPGGQEVTPFTDVGMSMSATELGLSLTNGQTYYVSVRATNGTGVITTFHSDGVTVNVQSCTSPGDCMSGFCAYGGPGLMVCCESACNDPCSICNNQEMCVPRTQGDLGDGSCGLFLCDGSQLACPTTCGGVGDCQMGAYCAQGTTSCELQDVLGNACTEDAACASGICSNGVCCDRPCDGSCESCALMGSEGTCTPVAPGTVGGPECPPYVCNGVDGYCPGVCDDPGDCEAASACDARGFCLPTRTLGEACVEHDQCLSGSCADGFCCDEPCEDGCTACDVARMQGTCTVIAGDNPDGCGAFACDGTSHECPTSCSNDDQCASHATCAANSLCVGNKPIGDTCAVAADCASGFCADGVCCDTPCSGGCEVCDLSSSQGTCSVRPSGYADADSGCGVYRCDGTAACPNTCATDQSCVSPSTCNGMVCSATKQPGEPCSNANECISGSCADGVCCDSDCARPCEACAQPGTVGSCEPLPENHAGTCGGYTCDGVAADCPTTCTEDGHCAPRRVCNQARQCVGGTALGEPCNAATECGSGFCVEGLCCESACDGEGESCSREASRGLCDGAPGTVADEGCGCRGVSTAAPMFLIMVLLVGARRRRRMAER